jgi:hypothetical protein
MEDRGHVATQGLTLNRDPSGRLLVVPIPPAPASPPKVAPTPAAGVDPLERVRRRVAEVFHRREVGPAALAAFSLLFAAAAGFVLLAGHPGFGGALGVVAWGARWLAQVPAPRPLRQKAEVFESLGPVVEILLVAGVFGGLAGRHSFVDAALGLAVLVLSVWLPVARLHAGGERAARGLWSEGERTGILLLGVLLGRPVPAMLALLVVCSIDAWRHLERVDAPAYRTKSLLPAWVARLFLPDGSFRPWVRHASLALTLVALVLLPRSDLWRF